MTWPAKDYRSHKFVARHLRMTEADRANKVRRQRERRTEQGYLAFSHNLKSLAKLRNLDLTEYYWRKWEEQEGCCAICGKPEGNIRLGIDHCHRTGKLRGLLCYSCNTKLGFVEKYLRAIINYLREHHLADN